MRTTEPKCPFCRAPRSPVFVAAVMSLVSCGTPTQTVTPPRDLPPQAADAARPDAPADGPVDAPDAPRPVDAAVDAPVDAAPAVKHKAKLIGRIFRTDPDGRAYHEVDLQLHGDTVNEYVSTGASAKGVFTFEGLPPGSYKLWISDKTRNVDGAVDVEIKRDQVRKLDIDLTKVAMKRRPPKPYGAPPARRRVV